MIGRRKRTYAENLHERARELRHSGCTYAEICEALGVEIPKSTLNHWVSDVLLTSEQQQRIAEKDREAAARGRAGGRWGGAAGFNREMKRRRLQAAVDQASPIVERLVRNPDALLLMAAALYIGEGAKGDRQFSFANSDPRVIQAWLAILRQTCAIDNHRLRCHLLLTEAMDEPALRDYWSTITQIPPSQFRKPGIRRDTGGLKRPATKASA